MEDRLEDNPFLRLSASLYSINSVRVTAKMEDMVDFFSYTTYLGVIRCNNPLLRGCCIFCNNHICILAKYRISPHQKNDSHNPCGLWESSYYVNLAKSEELLLVQCEVDSNGDSYRSTYHRVVTHAEEAHHLYVSRN